MKTILKCGIIFIIVILTTVSTFHNTDSNDLHTSKLNKCIINKTAIRIAIYDSISPSVNLLESALNYAWKKNGVQYELIAERIGNHEVLEGKLNNKTYDALVIGASGRQYFNSITEKWKEMVKNFIFNGGGYVGICGGANIVSQGIENPESFFDLLITKSSLKIVNVYLNDNQSEEWQYLWKDTGEDHIPLKTCVFNSTIFKGYEENNRFITYGGGPGMYLADVPDETLGEITPIAIYLEEPMNIAPLHYWRWENGEWKICDYVKTDIKGQWAGVETTFGKGKIIIFGHHPEIPPMVNGSITEFFGLSIYGIPRYVYRWDGGNQTSNNYNWWILRRSAALAGNVSEDYLPPIKW